MPLPFLKRSILSITLRLPPTHYLSITPNLSIKLYLSITTYLSITLSLSITIFLYITVYLSITLNASITFYLAITPNLSITPYRSLYHLPLTDHPLSISLTHTYHLPPSTSLSPPISLSFFHLSITLYLSFTNKSKENEFGCLLSIGSRASMPLPLLKRSTLSITLHLPLIHYLSNTLHLSIKLYLSIIPYLSITLSLSTTLFLSITLYLSITTNASITSI